MVWYGMGVSARGYFVAGIFEALDHIAFLDVCFHVLVRLEKTQATTFDLWPSEMAKPTRRPDPTK